MPLVNYESSDDSDEEKDTNTDTTESVSQKVNSSDESLRSDPIPNIFSRLPPPKTMSTKTVITHNSSLNDIVVNKSSSGPIKISVPSLKTFYEEDNDDIEEEERKAKKFKGSQMGTGLSSLLPKPKNSLITKSSSLIPQSLVRQKAISSVSSRSQSQKESKEENPINYFFSEEKIDEIILNENPLSDVEFGPKPATITSEISNSSESLMGPPLNPNQDITYKKLIASKFGEETPDQINIVDIDVSKHLSDSKDWLKSISEEKEEDYKGVDPSPTAKRKHQITYLALQAKQREVQLKNEWAQSRTTKTMSRSKYGF